MKWARRHGAAGPSGPTTTGRAELPVMATVSLSLLCLQWTMANSTAAVIAARKNHAPQRAPVRKSPIALPLNPFHSQYHSRQYAAHGAPNNGPNLVGAGGLRTERVGAGLSRTRTDPDLCTKWAGHNGSPISLAVASIAFRICSYTTRGREKRLQSKGSGC
jgi:hypothetical protein